MPYQKEYEGNRVYRQAVSQHFGPGYGYIEAQALHGVLRYYKPKRVVEIAGGVSTYCMLAALEMNRTETAEPWSLTCIEPHPSARLRALAGIHLIRQPVQTVPLEVFQELSVRDLLFIDSSHMVKMGSDVNHLILEVLPRLRRGVIVHFHDINLPYDYPRMALQGFLQATETSLCARFLFLTTKSMSFSA